MTDLSVSQQLTAYKAKHKIRFVTAASLFDGHDASINIMRRILQASGCEVIHLGHNRSVEEVVTAALQEDAQGIAISSYQGGHVEYFKYMVDLLRSRGGENIKVFGGGGGVIVPAEVKELHAYGVARIYSPEDGQKMGLQGMINDMIARCDEDLARYAPQDLAAVKGGNRMALARLITALEAGGWSGMIGLIPVMESAVLALLLRQLLQLEAPGARDLGRLALVAGAFAVGSLCAIWRWGALACLAALLVAAPVGVVLRGARGRQLIAVLVALLHL